MKLFLVDLAPGARMYYDEVVSAVIYARTPEAAVETFYRVKDATKEPVIAIQVPKIEGVVHSHFNAG